MKLIEINPGHLIPVRRILELRAALRCEHGETILTVVQFPRKIIEISSSRTVEDLRAEIERAEAAPISPAPGRAPLAEIEIQGDVYAVEQIHAIMKDGLTQTAISLFGRERWYHLDADQHAAIVAQWRAARATCGGPRMACQTLEDIRANAAQIDQGPRR